MNETKKILALFNNKTPFNFKCNNKDFSRNCPNTIFKYKGVNSEIIIRENDGLFIHSFWIESISDSHLYLITYVLTEKITLTFKLCELETITEKVNIH